MGIHSPSLIISWLKLISRLNSGTVFPYKCLCDIRIIDISASSAACSLPRVGNHVFMGAINDGFLTNQSLSYFLKSTNQVKEALTNSFASNDIFSGSEGSMGLEPILKMAAADSR